MDKGFWMLTTGVTLGFLFVQGLTYLQQHYLWAFFYHW